MALTTTSIKPNTNKKILLNRMYTENASLSSTLYTVGKYIGLGINNNALSLTDESLTTPIPLLDGTVNDDGSNTMTGSGAGSNTTNNTTTFKTGAGTTDVTAQNLIKAGTGTVAEWSISNLATNGTIIDITEFTGFWVYIKDQATLDKFSGATDDLQIRLGNDSSNFYYKNYISTNWLAVGWNWLSDNSVVSGWTTSGTPTGNIDYFMIRIKTNIATDTFVAGDVVYDLLRQWQESDLYTSFVLGYPQLDYTDYEATVRCIIQSTEANGFDIDSLIVMNNDTTKIPVNIAKFNDESKSVNDQFIFMIKDRQL